MADAWLTWNGDFRLSSSGDLFTVDGDDYAQQRIIRRLFTQVNGYVWHQDYGAGIPQRIGDPVRLEQINAIVRSQIALEDSVAPQPPPVINITEEFGGVFIIEIAYTSAGSKQQFNLTITV